MKQSKVIADVKIYGSHIKIVAEAFYNVTDMDDDGFAEEYVLQEVYYVLHTNYFDGNGPIAMNCGGLEDAVIAMQGSIQDARVAYNKRRSAQGPIAVPVSKI